MVCAESSASFSKTAAFLMSSLGEATERVTSMMQYWYSLGMAPLARLVMSVERRRGAAYRNWDAPGDLLRHGGSLCARSGGTAILFQRPESTKLGRQLRVKQLVPKK